MPVTDSAAEKRLEPLVLVDTAGLTEEEWLSYRRRGIGGSDVAALLGISPWRTARDLYYDKLNVAAVEDEEGNWVALEMGHLLEPLVAKIFERKTGYKIYQISGLGLSNEEEDNHRTKQSEPLSADLIIVDEFSMVDMWLASKFFSRIKDGARIVLVGDPDQLPSVGAGNVFREMIDCGLVPVTVLDQIFRQSKDSLIAYNAKFINEGSANLYFGPDFVFQAGKNQAETAEKIISRYCQEIEESGIDRVQILSPFRSEGETSAEQLNEAIRERVNPFRSAEEEIRIGMKIFRVNDRIMQTKNTEKVSNGDLGFIRYIREDEKGKRIGLDFGMGREFEYSMEDMMNLDLAYAMNSHQLPNTEWLGRVRLPALSSKTPEKF